MARPRKPDGDKLVPAKTTLTPALFDRLDRLARAREEPLALIIRERLERLDRLERVSRTQNP
jgi:hypothetical protein